MGTWLVLGGLALLLILWLLGKFLNKIGDAKVAQLTQEDKQLEQQQETQAANVVQLKKKVQQNDEKQQGTNDPKEIEKEWQDVADKQSGNVTDIKSKQGLGSQAKAGNWRDIVEKDFDIDDPNDDR